jgi:pimeloyl-ACP methyl ester carboxylesterase
MKNIIVNTTDNLRLSAIIEETEVKDKIVIMCHGIRGQKYERGVFPDLAEELLKKDIASIRFDFRGHGESEGLDKDVTITKEKEDIESIIKYVIGLGYKQIFLEGSSFATAAVSLIDYSKYDLIKGVIIWYGCPDLDAAKVGNLFSEENRVIAERDGYYTSKSVSTGKDFRFGKALFDEVYSIKPYENLSMIDLPIIFVHGTKDEVVSYEYIIKAHELCKNSRLEIIENGNHNFDNNKEIEMKSIEKIVDFVDKTYLEVNEKRRGL